MTSVQTLVVGFVGAVCGATAVQTYHVYNTQTPAQAEQPIAAAPDAKAVARELFALQKEEDQRKNEQARQEAERKRRETADMPMTNYWEGKGK